MDPETWGPCAWDFIHSIALNYPEDPTVIDRIAVKNFFLSLHPVLPCTECSDNFGKKLMYVDWDVVLRNKKSLFSWTVDIHNDVNRENGKPQVSYADAVRKYITNDSYIKKMAMKALRVSNNVLKVSVVVYLAYFLYMKK